MNVKNELTQNKLGRKEKLNAIQLMLQRHRKELPKTQIRRVTQPVNASEWVTISNDDKKIVSAGRLSKEGFNHWKIKDLITDNMYRGKGLASAVTELLVKKAIKKGAKTIETEVSYDNVPSKKIFEKLNFKEKKRPVFIGYQQPESDNVLYVWKPDKKKSDIKSYSPSLLRF